MKRAVKSVFQETTQDISEFEKRLASTLKPVRPPDQFVRELREKLLSQMEEGQRGKKLSTKNLTLLILAGLLSLILFIATAIRVLVSFLVGVRLFKRARAPRK